MYIHIYIYYIMKEQPTKTIKRKTAKTTTIQNSKINNQSIKQ